MCVEQKVKWELAGETEVLRVNFPSVTLSTKNLTWPDLRSNLGDGMGIWWQTAEDMAQPFKDRMECQFHATAILSERLKFQVHLRVMCANDAGESSLFISEGVHFAISYHHTLSQCWRNVRVFQYAVQLYSEWCRLKICSHKNTRQWKDSSDYNGDRVGRQHKLLPCVILNSKPYLRHSYLRGS
jgi:hypothetical protein